MIFLKNELLKWQGGVRGPCILGQPWAPQHGDPALAVTSDAKSRQSRFRRLRALARAIFNQTLLGFRMPERVPVLTVGVRRRPPSRLRGCRSFMILPGAISQHHLKCLAFGKCVQIENKSPNISNVFIISCISLEKCVQNIFVYQTN